MGAATLQWLDVIHNEPWASPGGLAGCGAGIAGLECSSGRRVPCDPTVSGTRAVAAFLRRGSGASDVGATLRSGRGSRRTPAVRSGPVLRLVEAHVGTEASRRQMARTSLRIITPMISAVCAGGNGPTSRRITATLPTLVVPGQAPFNVSGRLPARDLSQLCLSGAFLPWHPRGPLNQSLREAPSPKAVVAGSFCVRLKHGEAGEQAGRGQSPGSRNGYATSPRTGCSRKN
jgi:hypothetical protein